MTGLELADWRRRVSDLYAAVRAEDRPERGHALWRAGRDELFRSHPQSPLPPGDRLRTSGLAYWPYDRQLRFTLPLLRDAEPKELSLPAGSDGPTAMRRVGRVELPPPVAAVIDVWWLRLLPVQRGLAVPPGPGGKHHHRAGARRGTILTNSSRSNTPPTTSGNSITIPSREFS